MEFLPYFILFPIKSQIEERGFIAVGKSCTGAFYIDYKPTDVEYI